MNRRILLLGLMFLATVAQAQSLYVIELDSRPAAEVIPIIQPMLGPNDALTGEGYKLFLRSSPDTLRSVRDMLVFLDAPLKTLQVSVFQGSAEELRRLAANAGVQIDSGNIEVDVGDSGSDSATGGSARLSTADGSVSVGGISTEGSLRDGPIHRIRVTEGTEAYIETGQRIPNFFTVGVFGQRGFVAGVEYRDALTGFYVLPRIRGENVALEVSPFKSSQPTGESDEIVSQSASTTITGRMGEWLFLGGVTEQNRRSDSTIGNRIQTESNSDSGIWIRTDLIQ